MGVWKNIIGLIGNTLQFNFTGPKIVGSSTDTITITDKDDSDGKLAVVTANHETIEVYDGASRTTSITMAAGGAGDLTFVLPNDDGNANNCLTTDGAGNLSWVDCNNGVVETYTQAFDGAASKSIEAATTNRFVDKVVIEVVTAFDATGVYIDVGTTGTVDKFFDQTEVDLTTVGIYVVESGKFTAASEDLLVTFTAGSGGTQGSAQITAMYSYPGIVT